MLTPDEIAGLQEAFGQFSYDLSDTLIEQIVKQIAAAGRIDEATAYRIYKARELGISEKRLKQVLKEKLNLSSGDVRKLFQKAAYGSYSNDLKRLGGNIRPLEENGWLQAVLSGTLDVTQGTLNNLTQTMGFVVQGQLLPMGQAYRRACDIAYEETVTGVKDYLSAVKDACDGLYEKGIVCIDYESGVHTTLEAAVRRSLIGGLGLVNEQIEQHVSKELGTDGWEITAHENSAPDHEPIQGRQYSNQAYESLNNSLVRRIGTLNCGHSAFPIMLGRDPQYTEKELEDMRNNNANGVTVNGKRYTGYEATQKQRAYERAIRAQKRKAVGYKAAGDTARYKKAMTRIEVLKQSYNDFSKQAGLRTQTERMRVSGF